MAASASPSCCCSVARSGPGSFLPPATARITSTLLNSLPLRGRRMVAVQPSIRVQQPRTRAAADPSYQSDYNSDGGDGYESSGGSAGFGKLNSATNHPPRASSNSGHASDHGSDMDFDEQGYNPRSYQNQSAPNHGYSGGRPSSPNEGYGGGSRGPGSPNQGFGNRPGSSNQGFGAPNPSYGIGSFSPSLGHAGGSYQGYSTNPVPGNQSLPSAPLENPRYQAYGNPASNPGYGSSGTLPYSSSPPSTTSYVNSAGPTPAYGVSASPPVSPTAPTQAPVNPTLAYGDPTAAAPYRVPVYGGTQASSPTGYDIGSGNRVPSSPDSGYYDNAQHGYGVNSSSPNSGYGASSGTMTQSYNKDSSILAVAYGAGPSSPSPTFGTVDAAYGDRPSSPSPAHGAGSSTGPSYGPGFTGPSLFYGPDPSSYGPGPSTSTPGHASGSNLSYGPGPNPPYGTGPNSGYGSGPYGPVSSSLVYGSNPSGPAYGGSPTNPNTPYGSPSPVYNPTQGYGTGPGAPFGTGLSNPATTGPYPPYGAPSDGTNPSALYGAGPGCPPYPNDSNAPYNTGQSNYQAYGGGPSTEAPSYRGYATSIMNEPPPNQGFGGYSQQPPQMFNNTGFNQPPPPHHFNGDYDPTQGQQYMTEPQDQNSWPQVPRESFAEVAKKYGKEQPVMLRFIWLERKLGVALDNVIPDYGSLPLTPFYFHPEDDVLGELKKAIDHLQWISESRTGTLLKHAEQLLSLWHQKDAAASV